MSGTSLSRKVENTYHGLLPRTGMKSRPRHVFSTPFFSPGTSFFRAHEDAERKRRLRTLTNRINGRVMVLFMDRLSEIVEEKLRVLKASLVEKSDLLNR